jgi:hypothetical protein
VHLSQHITYFDSIVENMVKVKAVKTMKVVKAKAVRKNSSAAADEILCSPPAKKNGAVKTGRLILYNDEQKSYKENIAEIKQISGLIVCKLALE